MNWERGTMNWFEETFWDRETAAAALQRLTGVFFSPSTEPAQTWSGLNLSMRALKHSCPNNKQCTGVLPGTCTEQNLWGSMCFRRRCQSQQNTFLLRCLVGQLFFLKS
jgi:hypothetical protein